MTTPTRPRWTEADLRAFDEWRATSERAFEKLREQLTGPETAPSKPRTYDPFDTGHVMTMAYLYEGGAYWSEAEEERRVLDKAGEALRDVARLFGGATTHFLQKPGPGPVMLSLEALGRVVHAKHKEGAIKAECPYVVEPWENLRDHERACYIAQAEAVLAASTRHMTRDDLCDLCGEDCRGKGVLRLDVTLACPQCEKAKQVVILGVSASKPPSF
jgi:hypothetical protein